MFQKLTKEYQEDKMWWKVAESYFKSHNLVEHQIESYNLFMREKLASIITSSEFEYKKDEINYIVNFDNVYVKKPEYTEPNGIIRKIKPQDCRIRNLNYMCKLYLDITRYSLDEMGKINEKKVFNDIYVGSIPCMVYSEYCNLYNKDEMSKIKNGECEKDPGGYFIINGLEKVLMSQDRMAHNEIFVFKSKDKDNIKLSGEGEKNYILPCSWYAEVRSYSSTSEPNITTTLIKLSEAQLEKSEESKLYIEIQGFKNPIPIKILFQALGVPQEEIIKYICDKKDIEILNILNSSLNIRKIKTSEEAIEYLGEIISSNQKEKKISIVKKILREKLFQNLREIELKKYYLGHMIYQLLSTVIGRRKEDDRDHYGKKRIETAGNLINNLFKSVWKRVIREVGTNIIKKRTNDLGQLFYGKITNYLRSPFATGNWTATKTNKASKVGISQLLNRHNYVSTLSNLRRVITPNDKNSKIIKPRHLHDSQWCFICPAECFDPNTKILLWNGEIKYAYEIKVGEFLIDDNGNPVKVKSTCAGIKNMYEIKQENTSYIVTDNHILTLKIEPYKYIEEKLDKYYLYYYNKKIYKYEEYIFSNLIEADRKFKLLDNDNIIDISINDYLNIEDKSNLYGFKSENINWKYKDVLISPYIYGEMINNLSKINYSYIINHKDIRLLLLAGIIDNSKIVIESNEIILKIKEAVKEDILFLIKSLGYNCIININKIRIWGKLSEIPTKKYILPDNINNIYKISLIERGIGSFVGWQLENNGRFLLGDFTVVHNTPEGQSCGLVKNLSMLSYITIGSPEEPIKNWLKLNEELIKLLEDISLKEYENKEYSKVFLNGTWIGITNKEVDLVKYLKSLKIEGKIDYDVSISLNKEGVKIYTDGGRILCPFFVVENGKIKDLPEKFEWCDLIKKGIIEYLDPIELETIKHSVFPWDIKNDDNYCIIHPCFLIGVSASTAPYSDHNQSPRNVYQCLWEEESVLMSDGSKKRMKDIKIGDEIVTFNPETFDRLNTKVINCYTKSTSKKILKITTLSGREIIVTYDHKMMTNKGWIEAGKLNIKEDLLVISLEQKGINNNHKEFIILNEERLKEKIEILKLKKNLINGLKEKNYLPLKSTNNKLYILSRILGYIIFNEKIVNGRIEIEIDEKNRYLLIQDIIELGYNIEEYKTKIILCEELSLLMICLLYNVSKINNVNILYSNWIKNCGKLVIREFLAGFQSKNDIFYCIKKLNEYKIENKILINENNLYMIENIKNMYKILKIEINEELIIKDVNKCYKKIGYRYSEEKKMRIGKIIEKILSGKEIESKGDKIFVGIKDIVEYKNIIIGDLTTESDTHCFIGGDGFCVHNSAMGKQALGVFSTNFLHRYDTSAHILCYPQKPLVNTATMRLIGSEELPSGQNLIVAVMSGGYNQEDSVIVNKRALDNGALRSINYTTYSESCHRKGNTIDDIRRPEKGQVKEIRIKGYNKIDIDGLPKENIPITKKDVLIGKINITPGNIKDTSIIVKSNGLEDNSVMEISIPDKMIYKINNGSAVIDRSILTINEESYRTAKVRVRQMRIPEIGDKVASRSAQKGIIGMILQPENMPYSEKTGISPDLIMNPNAFPSRMTIAQAIETYLGKACALNGAYADCTPFQPEFNREIIAEELKKYGFEEYGDEVMINGLTGERMECKIFMGPTYYQRLKHMVQDKIHCLKIEDTEVLTINGWKNIGNITLSDKIAILKNNELIYENPINILYYKDYEGPMYYVKNNYIDLAVTGNHRMWVSPINENNYNFERADEIINKCREYKYDAEWNISHNNNNNNYYLGVPKFLYFLGIYYSIGFINLYEKCICIKIYPEIELPKFNKLIIKDNYYFIYDKNIYSYILKIGNKLPDWLLQLNKQQSIEFIDGLTIVNNKINNFNDKIQQICLHAGYYCKIKNNKCKIIKNKILLIVNNYEKQDKYIYEKCSVACLTVSTGIFYVRRNGKSCWTGNSRDQDGPRETLTRQPVEGRKRGGGFRMGEMETWCGISHGASSFLIDRLVNNSDGYEMFICDYCGNPVIASVSSKIYECKRCQQDIAISKVRIPYAFKLLTQELQACGIGIWYNIDTTKTLLPSPTPSH